MDVFARRRPMGCGGKFRIDQTVEEAVFAPPKAVILGSLAALRGACGGGHHGAARNAASEPRITVRWVFIIETWY
jgi:hypothetical protein